MSGYIEPGVRHLLGPDRVASVTRCRVFEITYESERCDGFAPATLHLSLRVTDNRFGKPEYVDLSAFTERERPEFTGSTLDGFMDYIAGLDVSPLPGGFEDGSWTTTDFIGLWETGEFTTLPRVAWQMLMGAPDAHDALREAAEFLVGELVDDALFELGPARRGHLRAI